MTHRLKVIPFIAALALVLGGSCRAQADDDSFFEKNIRPVLAGTCFKCHGGERTAGKLRIDSRESLLKGGVSGPAIVAGNPDGSLLLRALRRGDDVSAMPPDKALPATTVADFARWIKDGARWPATTAAFAARSHWAFQPLKPTPPAGGFKASNPIDDYINAKLGELRLAPAAAADRRTLIRRLTFDLTGLPPTPEEIEAFQNDRSANALTTVVDRLLASPHYGEQWGRHWLDLVRYADTAGETADFPVPQAWKYRNWVIDALNRDEPYDQFIRAQIAGDLLARDPTLSATRRTELITATGFISLARRFGFDILADHYLTIEDTIDTFGKSILGMTLACARCHDHKYDPVSQHDYYALYGIFESTQYPHSGCEKVKTPSGATAMRRVSWFAPPDLIYAVSEGKPHDAALHKRGNPEDRGEVVPRHFPTMFGSPNLATRTQSGRSQLADWVLGPAKPLTARVMVNRIWQHHFGAGLVKTPNDFGTRGNPPTHPELLDFLATRLIDSGWSIKSLNRLIVTSQAYQRSSAAGSDDWLAHFPRRRLSAEEIRDAILMTSGDLDAMPCGPHPFPAVGTWGFTQHAPFSAVYEHNHRSVYLMTQRIKRHPFLALFDGADTNSSTGERHATTVPTQALFFLNDPFVHEKAMHLAQRLESMETDEKRLDHLFGVLLGRMPTTAERQLAGRFLKESGAGQPSGNAADNRRTAWASWVRVMYAGNEFIYLD